VTVVLLVGAGAVGRRAARQLVETEGVEGLLVADREPARAAEVVRAIGMKARAVEWSGDQPLPPGVAAVAAAVDGPAERRIAERALEAGVPAACCSEDADAVRSLLDLDDAAREAGVALAAGCGLAPGLSDVLARHAAGALELVEEVHVARAGSAGPACTRQLEQSSRGVALEWRDGAWSRERAGSGRQLVWFPEPVGGRDCRRAGSGQGPLLLDALPRLTRASMRMARPHRDGFGGRRSPAGARRRPDPEGDWGAVWVEVRGRRGQGREVLVYGAVDRMAFAAGTVLALATAWLSGLGAVPPAGTGAHGLGALVDPVPFLAELSRRGVKAATFEGASGTSGD
jgi:lysine 6-dehydrogenase